MKIRIFFFLLLFSHVSYTQSASLQSVIAEIDFQQDTLKAVFDWVTDNIRYDVQKLKIIKERGKKRKDARFKSKEEYDAFLLENVIKTKKGVCEDYSLLFNAIVKNLGYASYIVEGYTKDSNGRINKSVGHVWNAVLVNGEWKLYDATWGAGYVRDGKKFLKNYNVEWFDVDPNQMLKDHMPFDPMWQLSTSPVSYADFESNTKANVVMNNFDFNQAISKFLSSDKITQVKGQLERSEKSGEGIRLLKKWREYLGQYLQAEKMVSKKGDFDAANNDYNQAVTEFNQYIDAKNKRFKGEKYSQEKAKEKLMQAKSNVLSSIEGLNSIDNVKKKSEKHN